MESLFRTVGIYSSIGQKYEPVDVNTLLYYKEAKDGQILEEGITEAGALSSWTAAATAYSQNATGGLSFHFNIWPGDQSFGGNLNQSILPVHYYISWVQYSSFASGSFNLQWREEFNGAALPTDWTAGDWASPKNLSTHNPRNISFVNGISILSMTTDNAVGAPVVPPPDNSAVPPDAGTVDAVRHGAEQIRVRALNAGGTLSRFRPAATYEKVTAGEVVRNLCGDGGADECAPAKLEQSLQASVFAKGSVQRVEGKINIARQFKLCIPHIDFDDIRAE